MLSFNSAPDFENPQDANTDNVYEVQATVTDSGTLTDVQDLQVTVTADQAVAKPKDPGTFTVRVTDHSGAPVRAQVSLAVIDEAVYGVKPDDTPDPVRFFHRREYTRVSTTFSREYYFTGYSGNERLQLARRRRRPFSLADFKGDKPVQPEVRKDFPDAISAWAYRKLAGLREETTLVK